jgi:hypothetical protein
MNLSEKAAAIKKKFTDLVIMIKPQKTINEAMVLPFPSRWWHHPEKKRIRNKASSALNPIFYQYQNLEGYCEGVINCLEIYRDLPDELLIDFDKLKNAKVPIQGREVGAFLRKDIYLHHLFVRFALYLKDEPAPKKAAIRKMLNAIKIHGEWANQSFTWTNNVENTAKELILTKDKISSVLSILNK